MFDYYTYIPLLLVALVQGFSGILYALMKYSYDYLGDYFGDINEFKTKYHGTWHLSEVILNIITPFFLIKTPPFPLLVTCSLTTTICELFLYYIAVKQKSLNSIYFITAIQGGAFSMIKTLMKLCIKEIFILNTGSSKSKGLAGFMSMAFFCPGVVLIIGFAFINREIKKKPIPYGFLNVYGWLYAFIFVGLGCSTIAYALHSTKAQRLKKLKKSAKKTKKDINIFYTLSAAFEEITRLKALVLSFSFLEAASELFICRQKAAIKIGIPNVVLATITNQTEKILLLLSPPFSYFLLKTPKQLNRAFLGASIFGLLGLGVSVWQFGLGLERWAFFTLAGNTFVSAGFCLLKLSFSAIFLRKAKVDLGNFSYGIAMSFKALIYTLNNLVQMIIWKKRTGVSAEKKYFWSYLHLFFLSVGALLFSTIFFWKEKNKTNSKKKSSE